MMEYRKLPHGEEQVSVIGLINKYYDLALLGDSLAEEHYRTLEKTAKDCVKCGHCDQRCPFQVKQQARMEEILSYFGV